MSLSRRNFLMAALAPPALGQDPAPKPRADAPLLPSAALVYDQLPVRTTSAGGQSRAMTKGKLATGEELEMHHTSIPAGASPHAGHRHVYGEVMLVREGAIEFTINDRVTRLGPGSAAYVSSNHYHAIKNAGDTVAHYFVLAIGPGAYR
jgi:quercetin dioxygenase-like cupin family protein